MYGCCGRKTRKFNQEAPSGLKLNWSSCICNAMRHSFKRKLALLIGFGLQWPPFSKPWNVAFEKKVPTQLEEFYLVLLAVLFFSVLIMNVFIGVICVPWWFYLPGRIKPAFFFPDPCKRVKETDMISTSFNLRSFCYTGPRNLVQLMWPF